MSAYDFKRLSGSRRYQSRRATDPIPKNIHQPVVLRVFNLGVAVPGKSRLTFSVLEKFGSERGHDPVAVHRYLFGILQRGINFSLERDSNLNRLAKGRF